MTPFYLSYILVSKLPIDNIFKISTQANSWVDHKGRGWPVIVNMMWELLTDTVTQPRIIQMLTVKLLSEKAQRNQRRNAMTLISYTQYKQATET